MAIMDLVYLLIIMMIVNNVILVEGLGLEGVISYGKAGAARVGIWTTFSIVLVTLVIYPINKFVIIPYNMEYLEIFLYILIAFFVSKLIEILVKTGYPKTFNRIGCDFRLIGANSAVLGFAIMLFDENYNILESLIAALGSGIGFIVGMVLFASVRKTIDNAPFVPESFKGVPIQLIALAIISLAFSWTARLVLVAIESSGILG